MLRSTAATIDSLQDDMAGFELFQAETEEMEADLREYTASVNAAFEDVNAALRSVSSVPDSPTTLTCSGYNSSLTYQRFSCSG